MSRTIKAIERHMISPVRLGLQSPASNLIGEWQQRGPETLSGQAIPKLRLAFAPTPPVIAVGAAA